MKISTIMFTLFAIIGAAVMATAAAAPTTNEDSRIAGLLNQARALEGIEEKIEDLGHVFETLTEEQVAEHAAEILIAYQQGGIGEGTIKDIEYKFEKSTSTREEVKEVTQSEGKSTMFSFRKKPKKEIRVTTLVTTLTPKNENPNKNPDEKNPEKFTLWCKAPVDEEGKINRELLNGFIKSYSNRFGVQLAQFVRPEIGLKKDGTHEIVAIDDHVSKELLNSIENHEENIVFGMFYDNNPARDRDDMLDLSWSTIVNLYGKGDAEVNKKVNAETQEEEAKAMAKHDARNAVIAPTLGSISSAEKSKLRVELRK